MKRTYQPNTRRRARKHGFRKRMQTRAGRAIISARRQKAALGCRLDWSTASTVRLPPPPPRRSHGAPWSPAGWLSSHR